MEYPDKASNIFPRSPQEAGSRNTQTPGTSTPQSAHKLQTINGNAVNGLLRFGELESGSNASSATSLIKLVDYRYARFVFDENTSTFRMLK